MGYRVRIKVVIFKTTYKRIPYNYNFLPVINPLIPTIAKGRMSRQDPALISRGDNWTGIGERKGERKGEGKGGREGEGLCETIEEGRKEGDVCFDITEAGAVRATWPPFCQGHRDAWLMGQILARETTPPWPNLPSSSSSSLTLFVERCETLHRIPPYRSVGLRNFKGWRKFILNRLSFDSFRGGKNDDLVYKEYGN